MTNTYVKDLEMRILKVYTARDNPHTTCMSVTRTHDSRKTRASSTPRPCSYILCKMIDVTFSAMVVYVTAQLALFLVDYIPLPRQFYSMC